jgi:AraC family transcriptional regulator
MSNARAIPSMRSPNGALNDVDQPFLLDQKRPSGMPILRLNRVMAFVDANVAQDLCVSTLAAVVGMSPYHFCRSFKQSTGITPHRYVLYRRMEQAMYLLEQKGIRLLEIAQKVGFSDQSQFTRVFHKVVGTTPSLYRKTRNQR